MYSIRLLTSRICMVEACCSSKWINMPASGFTQRHSSNESDATPPNKPSMSIAKFSKVQGKRHIELQNMQLHRRRAETGKMISPVRAMYEYCLTDRDLVGIPKRTVRSSFHGEPPESHYREWDVFQKAIKVHGGETELAKAIRNRKIIDPTARIKERLSRMSRKKRTFISPFRQAEDGPRGLSLLWHSGSGRVVLVAILVNGANFTVKMIAWLATGSHSIFAEVVHSAADTVNQMVLAMGILAAHKTPDSHHPYGYANVRYVSALVSGVGIFFFGTGLSFYHGISGIFHPQHMEPVAWALSLFALSFLSEGGTLIYAVRVMQKKAAKQKSDIWTYLRENEDPSLSVVFYEDCAAVLGVTIAAACVSASVLLGSSLPDAFGSLAIGSVLGFVAIKIISQSARHLIGRSIPRKEVETYVRELEDDHVVRAVHDVKATELGDGEVRLKAEIDFDGRNVAYNYLHFREDTVATLLHQLKQMQTHEELTEFLLMYGEGVIDQLGVEVDRVEHEIKKKHKEIRHMDLESL